MGVGVRQKKSLVKIKGDPGGGGAHRQRLRAVKAACLWGPLCIGLSRRGPLGRAKGVL